MELQPRKVLIIDGHPLAESFCCQLVKSYTQGLYECKIEVQNIVLREINELAILTAEHYKNPILKNTIKNLQEKVNWANHLVFIYPTWWGGPPALLKAFLDFLFTDGWAFLNLPSKRNKHLPLLKGKTGRVITTMDTPAWYYRLIYFSPGTNLIKKTLLEYCGIKPVKITILGSIDKVEPRTRQKWISTLKKMGKKDAFERNIGA